MKLTINQLKKIIKEETLRALREADEVFDWKILLDQVEAALAGEFGTKPAEWERLGAKLGGTVAREAAGPEAAPVLDDLVSALEAARADAAEGAPDEETLVDVQQHLETLRYVLNLEAPEAPPRAAGPMPFTVEEGPFPYSTYLSFGKSFSVTLSYEDANYLAVMVDAADGHKQTLIDVDNGKRHSVTVQPVRGTSDVLLSFGMSHSVSLDQAQRAEMVKQLRAVSEDM